MLTGWLVVVMASALLALRPMNELIGRQPATILWLIAVLLGTFFYREWLAEGRLERIDAGWIGAPGRVWRRIHDRYEHVFLTLTGLHVAMIFCGVLYGIASTGPVARAIVIGFVVLAVPLTVWATIQARRDLRERARTLAERELRYQRRANVRSVDDFAR